MAALRHAFVSGDRPVLADSGRWPRVDQDAAALTNDRLILLINFIGARTRPSRLEQDMPWTPSSHTHEPGMGSPTYVTVAATLGESRLLGARTRVRRRVARNSAGLTYLPTYRLIGSRQRGSGQLMLILKS